jgi:hypothetical protein
MLTSALSRLGESRCVGHVADLNKKSGQFDLATLNVQKKKKLYEKLQI